jgi:hypothetical protein
MAQEYKGKARKALDQVEKYVVLSSVLFILLLSLGLMFIQQMVAAQGRGATGLYEVFGDTNLAGFMLAIPVTVGAGFQLWRLTLYNRGILSGQWQDKAFAIFLLTAAVGTDVYVFLSSPVRPISPNMPRYVISAWVVAHVVQIVLEVVTDSIAEAEEEERKRYEENERTDASSFRSRTNHRTPRTTPVSRQATERQSVPPKERG